MNYLYIQGHVYDDYTSVWKVVKEFKVKNKERFSEEQYRYLLENDYIVDSGLPTLESSYYDF